MVPAADSASSRLCDSYSSTTRRASGDNRLRCAAPACEPAQSSRQSERGSSVEIQLLNVPGTRSVTAEARRTQVVEGGGRAAQVSQILQVDLQEADKDAHSDLAYLLQIARGSKDALRAPRDQAALLPGFTLLWWRSSGDREESQASFAHAPYLHTQLFRFEPCAIRVEPPAIQPQLLQPPTPSIPTPTLPNWEWVLPLPVWPYAKQHALKPASTCATSGAPTL